MRCLARMGLGLLGLALVAPTVVRADDPSQSSPPAGAQGRARRSLFHKPKLCAECQRAQLRAQGINVPPPPALPPGIVVSNATCPQCAGAAGSAPVMMNSAPMMVANNGAMPGYAIVGGSAPTYVYAGGGAPGYAVVDGMVPMLEPTPIGMVQGHYASHSPVPGRGTMPGVPPGPGMGPRANDPSVLPSSLTTEPYVANSHSHPHVLRHMFGLDAIGARARAERERRARESHAAISYQPQNQPVSELPAAMVYGR
jgi:hypothetical protein